jgi:trk system potassium uptake protein TrkA
MYIIVAGGGMVGGGLVRRLLESKHDVVLIEREKEICDRLYAETGVIAINGRATRIEVLKEANIEKADIFVAATGHDADNLAAAILAKSFNVSQLIVRMRNPAYENAYRVVGVDTIVRVTDLMVNQIVMEIEKPLAQKITSLASGRADIFRVVVPKDALVDGKSIQDIAQNEKFPAQCTFIAVYNQDRDEFQIPRGAQVINAGDELFLISTAENITGAADFLTART